MIHVTDIALLFGMAALILVALQPVVSDALDQALTRAGRCAARGGRWSWPSVPTERAR